MIRPSFSPSRPSAAHLPDAGAGARSFVRLLGIWIARARSRARLAELPPHLLRDIGVTRAQVADEASKPFWME